MPGLNQDVFAKTNEVKMISKLSKEELEQVAKELGISFKQAAALYQQATGINVSEKSLDKLFSKLKKRKTKKDGKLGELEKAQEELETTLKSINSNSAVQQIVDKIFSHNQQSQIAQTLKSIEQKMTPDNLQKVAQRQLYNSFTSQALNDEAQANVAMKEYRPKTKKYGSVYDLFTSRHMNPDGVSVSVKEDEISKLEQAAKNTYAALTSRQLNNESQDHRPKTGNSVYDFYTSRALNR